MFLAHLFIDAVLGLFRAVRRSRLRMVKWLVLIWIFAMFITMPMYYLPKTIWPPLQPAMTWRQIFNHLLTKNSEGVYHWAAETGTLWGNRGPVFWLTQIPSLVLLVLWILKLFRFERPSMRAAKQATHGSSRWRKPRELANTLVRIKCDQPSTAGIVVGSAKGTAWVTDPNRGNPHCLIIGATRSGKSRRVVMPSVTTIASKKESMVITDPKGEIYDQTASWLKGQGYEVVLLNLHEPTRGQRWNPLDRVIDQLRQGNEETATREAWEIGNILAFSAGPGSDPIWPQAEESLISALALAAAKEAPAGAQHMTTAYRILTELGADGGKDLDAWLTSLPSHHPARMAYGTAALSESRTRASIYTGTAAHLRLWADPGIAWLCSTSDFDPAAAGEKPMAIFVLMPDEMGARRNIANLFINQMYSGLAGLARRNGGRLPVPVWFLLDEFGNIGKVPNIAEKLTVAAGRGIRFVLAIQAKAQLEHVYGRQNAEIILANCDTWLYLRTADLDTAKEISQKAGTYTVVTQSTQRRGRGSNYSQSEGTTGRALLTPDEVLRWEMGESLLLQAGQYPARLALQDMSLWPAWKNEVAASKEYQDAPSSERTLTWVPGESIPLQKLGGNEEDVEKPKKIKFW